MTTILDILGTSTPVSESLAARLGYVKAAIACRIFFYEQLDHKVCEASVGTIAKKLGMSAGTVSNNINWLLENKYIKVIGKHRKGGTQPNKYKVAKRFFVEIQLSSAESQRSLDESQRSLDEIKRRDKEDLKESSLSLGESTEKTPEEKDSEIPKTDFELMQAAIKAACKINTTKQNEGPLLSVTRELMAAKRTPEQITGFADWYTGIFWQGKFPPLSKINELWPQYDYFLENGARQNGQSKSKRANGSGNGKTNGTGAALSAEPYYDPATNENVYPDGRREYAGV